MLPRRLSQMLHRLHRLELRTPDEQKLYEELLDVARRLHAAPRRGASVTMKPPSPPAKPLKLPTSAQILRHLAQRHRFIDDGPMILPPQQDHIRAFIDDPPLIRSRPGSRPKSVDT